MSAQKKRRHEIIWQMSQNKVYHKVLEAVQSTSSRKLGYWLYSVVIWGKNFQRTTRQMSGFIYYMNFRVSYPLKSKWKAAGHDKSQKSLLILNTAHHRIR